MNCEPLSEHEFEIAKAMRRIHKEFGSIGAFFAHLARKQRDEKKRKSDEQWRQLFGKYGYEL